MGVLFLRIPSRGACVSPSPLSPLTQRHDMADNKASDLDQASSAIMPTTNEERATLVMRARQFLLSPQVQNEDESAKRRFLQEKGLFESEIVSLLQEQVCQFVLILNCVTDLPVRQSSVTVPTIPPRT